MISDIVISMVMSRVFEEFIRHRNAEHEYRNLIFFRSVSYYTCAHCIQNDFFNVRHLISQLDCSDFYCFFSSRLLNTTVLRKKYCFLIVDYLGFIFFMSYKICLWHKNVYIHKNVIPNKTANSYSYIYNYKYIEELWCMIIDTSIDNRIQINVFNSYY